MSRVFVSNIPEKFTPQDLMTLMQQANIPCSYPEPLKILTSKRFRAIGISTGRYAVLDFDSDTIATTAIEAINMMVLTVDSKETRLFAAPYIANFQDYLENPMLNLVISNLPNELSARDLKDLFSAFGDVLFAEAEPPVAAGQVRMGHVIFETEEDARAALKGADGRKLGQNKLQVQFQQAAEQHMVDSKEVQILNVPASFDEDKVKEFIAEKTEMRAEDIFDGIMTLAKDPRPEYVNSGCQQAIFTCKTKEIAQFVVDKINALGEICLEEGKTIVIKAQITGEMPACTNSQQNRELYAESGRNVQVFGLRTNVTVEQVKMLFSRYGPIAEVSVPTRQDVNPNIFHVNVLFEKAEDAEKAVANATGDEEWWFPRLGLEGKLIRVQKYEDENDARKASPRQDGESGDMLMEI